MEESLERYVMFLREIGGHPNHYKKIVIRTCTIDKDTRHIKDCDGDGMEFEYDDIRKHDYIWNILASFIKWDVALLNESDTEIWFSFRDDNEISKGKFVYLRCFKAEWEAREDARCK